MITMHIDGVLIRWRFVIALYIAIFAVAAIQTWFA